MFARGLEGWHLIIIAVVVLVIWGGPKLPGMAKNLGESMRVFRKEMRTMSDEKAADKKAKSSDTEPKELKADSNDSADKN
ncbi:MAG: twin-arginine translocase TatA/TatE family subunit [Actinomycetota bacterium]|jgi:sec-independent protein translocase protein TatA